MTVSQDDHLTLGDSARRLGEAIWVEERLFEVLGAFDADEVTASARVALSEVSRRHGWRAAQLRDRLPEVPGFAAADVVAPPADGSDLLDRAGEARDVPLLLAAVEPVLARLDTSYEQHLERCSQVSDAVVARTLALVLTDLRIDRERLQSLL